MSQIPSPCAVPLGDHRWLLNLCGSPADGRSGLLERELKRLPRGGALYLIADGDPDSYGRSDCRGPSSPLDWRIVRAAEGLFEAVISRN
jgi:hypothetical protein